MNPASLEHLLTPRFGRTRQASSYGRDPDRGGTWFGLRPPEARKKRVLIEPGETHTMATMSGPGMITRLWMTTLLPFNPHALRNLVLRFYWDDESYPSVECPFGDFFGAPFGRYVSYVAEPMSLTNHGFNSLWPMPFSSSAHLVVTNEGSARVDPFFYQITYYQFGTSVETDLRFHAQWARENPTRPGEPYSVLNAEGYGHFVGCHLFMQNREWWLRPPISKIVFPYGAGMGMLEGLERIYIDGEQEASVSGTGTEDYFNGSGYNLVDGRIAAPYHGCTMHDYIRGRVAVYRFDVSAPVAFTKCLRFTIDHGIDNQVACDYASVAYWYQQEPHQPFPSLLKISRRPESPLMNVVQVALALGVPFLGALALLRKLCSI